MAERARPEREPKEDHGRFNAINNGKRRAKFAGRMLFFSGVIILGVNPPAK